MTIQTITSLLRQYSFSLLTEETKPIGVGIDVSGLLESLGYQKNMVMCNADSCAFDVTKQVLETSVIDESQGLGVSSEQFVLQVGETKTLTIAGGVGAYHLEKNNENIGFQGVSTEIGIASAGEGGKIVFEQGTDVYVNEEDNTPIEIEEMHDAEMGSGVIDELDISLFHDEQTVAIASNSSVSIKLLGLVPGTTTLTVTDEDGITKEIEVLVEETVFRMRPNQNSYVRPGSGRQVAKRGLHTYPTDLLDRFSYYRTGIFKIVASRYGDGEGIMTRTIYNEFERKNQTMQWLLRVSHTKERQPFEISGVRDGTIELEVGQIKTIDVVGGVPSYQMSHSSNAIRLDKPTYPSDNKVTMVQWQGVGIASAQDQEPVLIPTTVYEDEAQEEIGTEGAIVEDDTTQVSGEPFTGEELLFGGYVQEGDPQEGEQISIASTAIAYPVEIHATNPGESTVQVIDSVGQMHTFQVIVKEKVAEGKVGDRFKWYYIPTSYQPFYVAYVDSDNQDIVKTYKSGRSFYAEIVQPGKAKVTVGIAAKKYGSAYTTMELTVLARSNQLLSVSQEAVTVQVGEWVDVQLNGGLPKYTVSRSNENIGLGNLNATQLIGVAGSTSNEQQVEYEMNEQGTAEYTPVDQEEQQASENGAVLIDELYMDYGEEEIIEEYVMPASSEVTRIQPNVLSIVGLVPGTSEVSVEDELGYRETIVVTVVEAPKRMIETSLTLRFVESEHEYGAERRYLDAGQYHDERDGLRPYGVEKITSSSRSVYNPYFRSFRGWYEAGGVGGEAIVTYHIYLPLEKRRVSYSKLVEVLGPTLEEVQENDRLRAIHWRETNGVRSSIEQEGVVTDPDTTGEGNGGDADNLRYFDKKQYVVNVGDSIQIDLKNRSPSNTVRLGNRKIMHLSDSAIGVAESIEGMDIGYSTDGEIIIPNDETETVSIASFEKTLSIGGIQPGTSTISVYAPGYEEQVEVTVVDKTYTIPLGRGYVPFGKHFDIRSVSSSNTSVMNATILNDNGEQGLFYVADSIGSTVLSMEVYNRLLSQVQTISVKLNVVSEELDNVNAGDQSVYKYTMYLKPNTRYNISIEELGQYSLKHYGSLTFLKNENITFNDNMYVANNGQQRIVDLIYSNTYLSNTFEIVTGFGEQALQTIEISKDGTLLLIEIVIENIEDYTYTIDSDRFGGIIFGENTQTAEDYVINVFLSAKDEVLANVSEYDYDGLMNKGVFFKNFRNIGSWNFKLFLERRGYLGVENNEVYIGDEKIHTSELGNLLYGYLGELGGIYDFAIDQAYQIEYDVYRKYYGEELGIKRTQADELNDVRLYELGKDLAKEMRNQNISFNEMKSLISGIFNDNRVELDILGARENEILEEVCWEVIGTEVECWSSLCSEIIEGYYIFNGGMKITESNC